MGGGGLYLDQGRYGGTVPRLGVVWGGLYLD